MDISQDALVVLSQIIPILLLASYLDRDVLQKVSTYSNKTKYYWFCIITFILFGELIAISGLLSGPVDGWRGLVIVMAAFFALANLFSIAGWRVLGLDLVSGLPTKSKKQSKKK